MTAICLGCMKRTNGEKKFCPYCGFNYENYMEKRNENSLPPGTLLNHRYLLGKVLGSGGFGITYLGLDQNLERKVAIKEYFPTANASRTGMLTGEHSITVRATGDGEAFTKGLENFLAEARTLASLNKAERKAVVSVIDYFNANGTGYMVMEYLPGPNLKSIIKNRKTMMTEEEIWSMISPVLDSLAMIHAQDLIHRDISPDNLVMDDSGNLVLVDFGASRSLEGDKSMTVVLKPGFAPFEQYTRDGAQGPWTDVYALCATMYCMVTVAVPPASTDRAMALASGSDPLMSLSDLNMPVSKEFSDVIYKGLSLSIEDRYQTVTDLKNALAYAINQGKISHEGHEATVDKGWHGHGYYDPNLRREKNGQFDRDETGKLFGDGRDRGGRDHYEGLDYNATEYRPPKKDKDTGRIILYAAIGLICLAIILISTLWLASRNRGIPSENSATTSYQTMVAGDEQEEKTNSSSLNNSAAAATEIEEAGTWESGDQDQTDANGEDQGQSGSNTENQDQAGAGLSDLDRDITDMGDQDQADMDTADTADGTQPSYLTGKYEEEHVIKIYTEPDKNSPKVSYGENNCLPESVFVAVLDQQGSYSKIWYGGISGWVQSRYLISFSDTDDYYMWEKGHGYTAYVFVNEISAHKEASESSAYVSGVSLHYGKELKVQEVKNGFARVKTKGKTCWVDMHFIRTYAKKNRKWKVDIGQGQDGAKSIHLREKAGETSNSLKKIKDGKVLKISKFEDGWGKTKYDGKDGWVKLKDCTPVAD